MTGRRRVITGTVLGIVLCTVAVGAQPLPTNLSVVDERLRAVAVLLRIVSPTFARQCAALGRPEHLTLHVEWAPDRSARHVHTRFGSGPDASGRMVVTIALPPGVAPEMLAHAFEHVLEAMARHDASDQEGVGAFRQADGSWETIRAQHVQRVVRREIARGPRVLQELLSAAVVARPVAGASASQAMGSPPAAAASGSERRPAPR